MKAVSLAKGADVMNKQELNDAVVKFHEYLLANGVRVLSSAQMFAFDGVNQTHVIGFGNPEMQTEALLNVVAYRMGLKVEPR